MGEPQVNTKKSGQPDENPHFGFVLSGVFIVIGLVLFFGWENFGNETLLKIFGSVSLAFGLIGLGVEVSNKSNNDGGLEAALGLSSTFFILMFKDAVPGTPNFVLFIFLIFSLFCVGLSVSRLIPSSKEKRKNEQIETPQISEKNNLTNANKPLSKVYKVCIIITQILAGIVSTVNFIKMFM